MDKNLKKDVMMIILLLILIIVLLYLLWAEIPYWRNCLKILNAILIYTYMDSRLLI